VLIWFVKGDVKSLKTGGELHPPTPFSIGVEKGRKRIQNPEARIFGAGKVILLPYP
jgi:hypothetical protein